MMQNSSLEPDAGSAEEAAARWESFPPYRYHGVARGFVHHSFKTVNSNAAAGGIRLGRGQGLRLPYVSARTLLGAGLTIEPDYTANAGKTARIAKQMRAVARQTPLAEQAPPDEAWAIRTALSALADAPYESGTERIDLRLRQLLVPKGDGYVVLSPLTAAGVCMHLFERGSGLVDRHEASHRRIGPEEVSGGIRQAHLGVGGANPQNVGALVRAMQRPLFVPGPRCREPLERACEIHARGIELPALDDLAAAWRSGLADVASTSDPLARDAFEAGLALTAADRAQASGAEALDTLLAHADRLPVAPSQAPGPLTGLASEPATEPLAGPRGLLAPAVQDPVRGLIDPLLRGPDWPARMAALLATRLARDQHADAAPLPAGDVLRMARHLEEALR